MSVDLPTWTAFDPDALPDLPTTPSGRVVAVVASAAAWAVGWAATLAAEMARTWSRRGRRVVLADLGLTRPTLHQELGQPDGEGISDAVLFGSSPARVARLVEGESFFLVPAGTVVADARAVLGSPRWGKLCKGFEEAGVVFLAFIPETEPARRAALSAATDVVVLAGADEDVSALLEGVTAPVISVVGREQRPRDGAGTVDVDLPPPVAAGAGDIGAKDEQGVSATVPVGSADAAEGAMGVDSARPGTTVPLREPAASKRPSRRSSPAVLVTVILVVIVVALLIAVRLGLIRIPGISSSGGAPESSVSVASGARALPPAISPEQGYSLTAGSYRTAEAAEATAKTLAGAAAKVLITVVPVGSGGAVQYRLLLGPASDSAQARALARQLGAAGVNTSGWPVTRTPWAFQLDEVDSLEAARHRVEALRGQDVPAYVLAVDFADGSTRYRVYAGAFANQGDASWLEQHLASRGLTDATFANRIGRLPE